MADDDNITFESLQPLLKGQQSSGAAATDFDSQTQTNLNSLQPDFADRARQWVQAMRDQGFDPVLHYGYRTPQEQQDLYQKYLAGGNKAAPPQASYHTYGRAFDWVNRNAKTGKLEWNNDAAYAFGQKMAKQFGLTGISGDNDHIQDANYKSWKDLPREEYGNPRPRQVAQTTTTAAPVNLPSGGTTDGITWQNLSSLIQR